MSEWQPIATAPRDTTVLLYLPDSEIRPIVMGHRHGRLWYEEAGADSAFPIDVPVTHWQPLPPPPETTR